MRIQDFKDGKISVWAETKPDAERFLKAMKQNGIKWACNGPYTDGDAAANREYASGYQGMRYVTSERGWFSRHDASPGKPYTSITVAEFFKDAPVKYTIKDVIDGKVGVLVYSDDQTRAVVLAANRYTDKEIMLMQKMLSGGFLYPSCFGVVDGAWRWVLDLPEIEFPDLSLTDSVRKEERRNEQIIAYYNPDGTVTCLHKRDGKVVGSATVKKYYTDADDLRVAAKYALEKMLGRADPFRFVGKLIRPPKE